MQAQCLDIPLFPRQLRFHESSAKYRLFGGAAGGGKSVALLWEAIAQAGKYPGADTLLLRRTYPELEGSLIRQFQRDILPLISRGCVYNVAKHLVSFHNGSTLRFGHASADSDVQQYQGGEFVFIGIDELTHFPLKHWQFLTSRNRCRIPGSFPCMAGATNPGNIGHTWVKALWIDKQPPAGWDGPYDPADYEFIPARIEDNPIYAQDAGYRKTLEALPTHLRQAFLEGSWDVFAGQYFDVFDPTTHVVDRDNIKLEPWWPRWISVDWGFEHPAAVYWNAQDGRRTITYREFVQNRLSPRMLAQAITEKSADEKISAVYLSPDAFAKRTAEATIAEQMGEVLGRAGLPRPAPADDDRIGGWMLLYQLLESEAWIISADCAALIECLPDLVRDTKNVEDVAKRNGDDPADAVRYGLKSRLSPARPPLEVRVQERLAALPPPTSPTGHAMQMGQAIRAEQQKQKPVFVRGTRFHRRWN